MILTGFSTNVIKIEQEQKDDSHSLRSISLRQPMIESVVKG
jgi:hypothetical protein